MYSRQDAKAPGFLRKTEISSSSVFLCVSASLRAYIPDFSGFACFRSCPSTDHRPPARCHWSPFRSIRVPVAAPPGASARSAVPRETPPGFFSSAASAMRPHPSKCRPFLPSPRTPRLRVTFPRLRDRRPRRGPPHPCFTPREISLPSSASGTEIANFVDKAHPSIKLALVRTPNTYFYV